MDAKEVEWNALLRVREYVPSTPSRRKFKVRHGLDTSGDCDFGEAQHRSGTPSCAIKVFALAPSSLNPVSFCCS